jgi:hypothetical protein
LNANAIEKDSGSTGPSTKGEQSSVSKTGSLILEKSILEEDERRGSIQCELVTVSLTVNDYLQSH